MITNKSFQIDLKTIALIVLLLYVGYTFFLKPEAIEKTVVETETIDIKKVVEEAINNKLQLQKPTQQPVIVYRDRVVPIHSNTVVAANDLDKVKNLNKYQDTTQLANGKIFSTILSDGKVYSNKVIAEIDVKTITKTKETKIVKQSSGLFVSPSVNFSPLGIDNIGVSLNYIYKNDIGIGAGAFINTQNKSINYGVTFHKKIF